MFNFYLLRFESTNYYFATCSNHITKVRLSLEKYCCYKISGYDLYRIGDNYPNVEPNKSYTFLYKPNFIMFFTKHFKNYHIKETWFKFDFKIYPKVLEYLKIMESAIIYPIDNPKPKIIKPKQTYKCQRCNIVLNSINYLQRHLTKCNGLKCPKCDVLFSSRYALNSHISNCGIFICHYCDKEFKSKFMYSKHLTKCKKKDKPKNSKNEPNKCIEIPKGTIENNDNIVKNNDNIINNNIEYKIIDSSDEDILEDDIINDNIDDNNIDNQEIINTIDPNKVIDLDIDTDIHRKIAENLLGEIIEKVIISS